MGAFIEDALREVWLYLLFIKFTKERFWKKLLRWIVMDDQPLIVTERQEFQDVMNYLRASTTPLTADTIRRDLNVNFTSTKEQVRKELQVSDHWLIFVVFEGQN